MIQFSLREGSEYLVGVNGFVANVAVASAGSPRSANVTDELKSFTEVSCVVKVVDVTVGVFVAVLVAVGVFVAVGVGVGVGGPAMTIASTSTTAPLA